MSDITRQQAIYYLKAMRTMCVFQDAFGEPVDTDVYDEALDMAISSLEVDEAYQLMYEGMRPATPEEKASIRKHLDEISEPTGININDLYSDHHKQNIQSYAHDFGVSEEQAEKELRVEGCKHNPEICVDKCILKSTLEDIKSELWMEGMNMVGEYQGVWVRYRDIEKAIDKHIGGKE